MDEKTYHNKNLREELIKKGLKLYNEVGYEGFSLRKVASLCGVSHNAPYRHFKDKEELIKAMLQIALVDFQKILTSAIEEYKNNPKEQIRHIGINYICFFVENTEYLNLFFHSEVKGSIYIKDKKINYDEAYLFEIIMKCFQEYYDSIGKDLDHIIVVEYWSLIHGVTTFIVNKKIIFQENYRTYVEQIVDNQIKKLPQK